MSSANIKNVSLNNEKVSAEIYLTLHIAYTYNVHISCRLIIDIMLGTVVVGLVLCCTAACDNEKLHFSY